MTRLPMTRQLTTKPEDVIGERVALRNAGGGNLKGLCPFHDEKSPSFYVNVATGLYHCFGCTQGGDVYSFVREIDKLIEGEIKKN